MAAGGNAIGTGALILSANADKMLSDLNKAEKGVKKSAANMKAAGNFTFGEGVLGGFAGGIAGKLGGDALKGVGKALLDTVFGKAAQQEQTHALERALQGVERAFDRATRKADEWLNAIADPKKRAVALGDEIGLMDRKLAESIQTMKDSQALLTKLRDPFSAESIGARATGSLEEKTKQAELQLKAAESAVDKLNDRLYDLREARDRALNPGRDPALIGEVNKLTESLKLQAATFGMTSGQAKLYELRMRGASAEQLREAEQLTEELDRLQKAAGPNPLSRLAGAFAPGSADAYSIVARFQTGNMVGADAAKKQLQQLQGIKAGVDLLAKIITNRGVIGAV